MGLLTILRKVKQEEREVRILVLGLDNAGKSSIVKRLCGQSNINDVEPTLGFQIHTLEYNISNTSKRGTSSSCGGGGTSNSDHHHQQTVENGQDRSTTTTTSTEHIATTETKTPMTKRDSSKDGVITEPSATNGSYNSQPATSPFPSSSFQSQSSLRIHLWDIGGQSTIRAYWRNYFEQTDGLIWVVDSSDVSRLNLVAQELQNTLQQEKLTGATLLVFANKTDLVLLSSNDDDDDDSTQNVPQQQDTGSLLTSSSNDESTMTTTPTTTTTAVPTGGVTTASAGTDNTNLQDQMSQDQHRNTNDDARVVVQQMVVDRLHLNKLVQYENRHWNVVGCSALTGDGLQQGIDWLIDDIQSRLSYC